MSYFSFLTSFCRHQTIINTAEPSPTGPYATLRTMLKIGHNTSDPPYAREASNVLQATSLVLICSRITFDFF